MIFPESFAILLFSPDDKVNENSFKDGSLLLYNKDRGYFYSITPDMFLNQQNAEIKKLKKIDASSFGALAASIFFNVLISIIIILLIPVLLRFLQ